MPATATSRMIQRAVGDDGICILTFDRPESGANVFDAATMTDLSEHLDFVESESSIRGLIVTSAKKAIFVAGADLKTLLRQAENGELREFIAEGQRVFNRLAELKIPTCAAIHGASAGGGYEVALACDWRVASNDPSTRIGLPETTLGLVPAWGGCVRLARLIGAPRAAEVISKGKLYPAAEALSFGLIDEAVAREQLLDAARRKVGEGKRKHAAPPSKEPAPLPAKQKGGNPAPARAIEIINAGLSGTMDQALALELDAIVELGETESTRNLIRNFFLAEKYKRGTSKASADKIIHAAVIGAGVMGAGIAQWLSARGVTVILRDVGREQLDHGLASIEKIYADAVKRGLLTDEIAKEGRARIVASTAPVEMRAVQIVIEAASEKLEIKKQIFRELGTKVKANAILATNTSALPISELATETGSTDRVVGLHFFNPVSRMKLIEVVIGDGTSAETKERSLGFARQIGKVPVVVRDRPGFLVNRVLFPYLLDAAELFEAGTDAAEIDEALLKWGMPMGPLRLIDEIGVDVTIDIAQTLEKAFGRRDHAAAVLDWLRENKMLGRKSGAGFYRYEGKTQTPNEPLMKWRRALHGEPEGDSGPVIPVGGTRDPHLEFGPEELAQRLVFLMVNEAARCLEEGVVESPADADYGMILGTGFPAYRGGPLRFAEDFGIDRVAEGLQKYAQKEEKFAPCDLLKTHAREGTKFYES